MKSDKRTWINVACAVAIAAPAAFAFAASDTPASGASMGETRPMLSDTQQQVASATRVVEKLESEPQIRDLLGKAKGIFIVPTYARGGWGIGARGGEGVMLVNKDGQWSSPVFYNYGGLSTGLQAGVEVGSIAMLLMNDKAVNEFSKENNFALNAGAGLTIVNYTGKAQAAAGNGDVVVWSDTKGAFANATVGITDIHYDDGDNREYYRAQVSAKDIISGKTGGSRAKSLKQALSTQGSGQMKSSGDSGTGAVGASSAPAK
ncbi:lipid-binding SYLF domain-containing protein [Noviherbaspirillum aerium]|uniref:lipid-binding SYLF domain-containing protein n=1 Tax=Noviherbaspirillum aerium TaxID=2588497 RepID=UPI00178C2971|nr:lipid-binding SYLF domain-containing protein [Noviherbaspirillum aerium]